MLHFKLCTFFFLYRINFIRIVRLKIIKNNLRINNRKVEAQENFKYSYKKRVYRSLIALKNGQPLMGTEPFKIVGNFRPASQMLYPKSDTEDKTLNNW